MTKAPTKAILARAVGEYADSQTLLVERIAELELALEDVGWTRTAMIGDREFTRQALRTISRNCRIAYLKNPLINRAIETTRFYVFGHAVSIQAQDPDINAVVQAWLDDPRNKVEFTSGETMGLKEVDIEVDGNVFLALFTNPSTGYVTIRSFPFDEIEEIITNPEDRKEHWFYKRVWNKRTVDMASGIDTVAVQTTYYPCIDYDPVGADRVDAIGGKKVEWDTPVLHVKVGGTSDMLWGVPEVYSAIDWARAVTRDLETYATMKMALARFALSLTVKGGKTARDAAKSKLATTFASTAIAGGFDTNPPPVTGSAFIASEGGTKLDVIRTAGAQPNPEEGRALRLMVSAATGIPETILMGNADVGNRATAQTLDRPTELKMRDRQSLWAAVLRRIIGYLLRKAVDSPSGPLTGKGTVAENPITGLNELVWGDETDTTITIDFPDIVEHDTATAVKAIVDAATLAGQFSKDTLPDREVSRALMQALNWEDVDSKLEDLYPEGENTPPVGNFQQQPAPMPMPGGPPKAGAAAKNGA